MTLNALILAQIRSQQVLNFADFMQLALYAPEGGYYTLGLNYFGQDFTTAPEISPLFAACLANQCLDILSRLSQPVILEFGAGSGRLCIDLLLRLERLGCLPDAYYILEVSGTLQSQQRQAIAQAIPHLLSKVQWLTTWPSATFEGVILANEVLDAMPVHRFLQTDEDIFEIGITAMADDQLCEVLQPCQNERLRHYITHVLALNQFPYQSEVNLFLEHWLQQCANVLSKGAMLLIDYGFPRAEYYHPDRVQGTLMCHYRHRAHSNPLCHIGEQDITAHVDFTHVAECAVQAGFRVSGFTSQASFLLANGLLSLVDATQAVPLMQQQQAVKVLTHPHEMGELFKVMALTRSWDEPLRGFQIQDRRARL